MSPKKLGRGLDALIKKTADPKPPSGPEVQVIDPRQIAVNRSQPRHRFDDDSIQELATSIRNQGLLQPLVVRTHESGGFELVAGERRLRAILHLGLTEVPVVVQQIQVNRLLEIALIENIQREDLNPVELAFAYRDLMSESSCTQAELANTLGKKRSTVANTLRYLDLPDFIQSSLAAGQITAGHAKLLLSVGDMADQKQLHEQLVAEGWTVRRLEDEIQGPPETPEPSAAPGDAPPASTAPAQREPVTKAPHIEEQESLLGQALGTKVLIQERRGRGKITIEFYSSEDFERLRHRFLAGESRG